MHSVKGEDAAPPRTEAARPRTARLVAGRYRLEQPIGRGAMGTVWRGRDVLLDRDVAIKEVRSCALATPAESQDAYLRTLREAKAAARLNHPAAVTVFDVFEEHGTPWIVMELVSARSLDRLVAEDGPLRPRQAARLGEHLLSALACAHAAGVLHRDVKPANVLVAGGSGAGAIGAGAGAGATGAGAVGAGAVGAGAVAVGAGAEVTAAVLTDFGIATMAGDPALTQVGMVFGTPGFTAPERLHGDPATPASDLWSLGATLYMAVEGRGPFERPGGSAAIIAGVAGEPAPRAPSAGPLGPVIDALLQADPARRPDAATAAAMLADASAGPDRAGLPDGRESLREPFLRGQHDAGWPSPVGTPRFSDQPGAGPRSFLDAPSLLDQPEFLYQSGLLNPPGTSTAGPPSGVRDDAASGFSPPHRRRWRGLLARGGRLGRGGLRRGGRGKRAAITAVAVIAAGLAGYAAYPRPAGLDVTSPPTAQGQTPATGTGTGSNASRGSQPAGRDTASPAGSAPAGGTGQSTSSGPDGTGGTVGPAGTAGDGGAAGAPAGYRWYQVTAAASGTVAGFEIAVPDPWQASQPGLDSILRSPGSAAFIEVSLAPFRYTRPLREAEFRQAQAIRHDPGYHLAAMRTGTFLGGADAAWEFSRQDAGIKVSVEELLVTVDTTAGAQPYALTVSAPSASFGPALAVFRQALATFQPVP